MMNRKAVYDKEMYNHTLRTLKTLYEKQNTPSIMFALDCAKSVVERQIPKKPKPYKVKVAKILIGNGYWGKGTTVYKCPYCGEYVSRIYKHCGDCGQALDWSDE